MFILIDPGHGVNTPGKRSPDGRFREYAFNRTITGRLAAAINSIGSCGSKSLEAKVIVPELEDIPLAERCRRVNDFCRKHGTDNVLLLSIHANAAGNGNTWMNAKGWSAYTTPGSTKSDALAECLYTAANECFPGHKIRRDTTDGDSDIEANFYILRHTLCPAVLTENFFYDNPSDLAFLESTSGQDAIVQCHLKGLLSYLRT